MNKIQAIKRAAQQHGINSTIRAYVFGLMFGAWTINKVLLTLVAWCKRHPIKVTALIMCYALLCALVIAYVVMTSTGITLSQLIDVVTDSTTPTPTANLHMYQVCDSERVEVIPAWDANKGVWVYDFVCR